MGNSKLLNSSVLSWGSITAGFTAWAIDIFAYYLWEFICSYVPGFFPGSMGDFEHASCIDSVKLVLLISVTLLAFVSLVVGAAVLIAGKDKRVVYRFLSLSGVILSLVFFVLLGLSWFIHD